MNDWMRWTAAKRQETLALLLRHNLAMANKFNSYKVFSHFLELLHSRVILGYKWHDNCDPNLSSTEIMHLCEDQTPSAGDHNLVNVNQKQLHLTFDRFWHYRIISHYYLTVLLHLIHSTLIVHSLQTKLTNHERTGTCWAHLARLSSLSECILVIQMEVGQWRERRASQFWQGPECTHSKFAHLMYLHFVLLFMHLQIYTYTDTILYV